MSALPSAITEQDARAAISRLAAIDPGRQWVVTCYLKLEPRDRTRGKYLIKMKNRVRERELALARQPLSHEDREAIAANLRQVLDYLEEPNHLPRTRGIAIVASRELGLFETLPLPHVHRSRLLVDHQPIVRELLGQRRRAQLPSTHSDGETAALCANRRSDLPDQPGEVAQRHRTRQRRC